MRRSCRSYFKPSHKGTAAFAAVKMYLESTSSMNGAF
jgi:hypothetical protein